MLKIYWINYQNILISPFKTKNKVNIALFTLYFKWKILDYFR